MADYTADNNVAVPTLNISGTFEGAGILVLDGVALNISGNFRWEGLILVAGPKASLSVGGGGTQIIYGSVLVNDSVACGTSTDIQLNGNPSILYSQAAINNAAKALGVRYTYWNQRAP